MKRLTILTYLIQFFLGIQAQERINDKLPKIAPIATIANMTGWLKDDLGQWHSGLNSLANPKLILQKIELYRVEYGKDTFYSVAKFTKENIYHNGHYIATYNVDYWLITTSSKDTLYNQTAPVQYVCYKTLRRNTLFGTIPLGLKDISNDIAKKDGDNLVLGRFCIEARRDDKHQKMQFLIGGYDDQLGHYDFDDGLDQANDALERAYFEVPTNVYQAFVNKLK